MALFSGHRSVLHQIQRLAMLMLAPLWLALSGCGNPAITHQEAYVFGTRIDLTLANTPPETAKAAISEVLQTFDRLHRTYHAWEASELTALNQAIAAGKPHRVSPELAGLITQAQALTRQGQGLFDPGIGQLIALWGFQSSEFPTRPPAQADLAHWLKRHPSITQLRIDPNGLVRSQNADVALDFGGYLKGWALDEAAHILRKHGVQNALINIGGNILAMGYKSGDAQNGKPWQVGIQHPRKPGTLATIELQDGEAIGTSGDYQRFFEADGQRYPHLLDPRTGKPSQHTQAVTVLIQPHAANTIGAGTLSDASSKPIFIAGPEGWRAAAQAMNVTHLLRVDSAGRVQVTLPLATRLRNWAKDTPLDVVDDAR